MIVLPLSTTCQAGSPAGMAHGSGFRTTRTADPLAAGEGFRMAALVVIAGADSR